jgi:altronate hydrolase
VKEDFLHAFTYQIVNKMNKEIGFNTGINDLVTSSALGFSGCQLVLFTTGRGTPFGSFVPNIKISTQTALFVKKKNWIDFNAVQLLEGKGMEHFYNHINMF